jgi:alkylhydroperoxidase family enzyme
MDIGSAVGRASGVSEEQLRDLAGYRDSSSFSPTEKLVLEYADALTRAPVKVPDELFKALRESFDDGQLVELTAAIAWENYRSRFNRGFEVEAQGFSEGHFCVLPAREQR